MKYGIAFSVVLQTLTVICWGQFNNTNYGTSSGNGGGDNSFFGYSAGNAISTGQGNTFVGSFAGRLVTTGGQNVFVGYAAGRNTVTVSRNVFVGNESGVSNTLGTNNTFLGDNSGYKNTTGQLNTFLGSRAGYNTIAGLRNTYTGQNSGNTAEASDNTFYGYSSGGAVTSGNQNTIIGTSAGSTLTTGVGNVFLGYRAGANETTGSNKLYIENSNATIPLVYGDFATDKVGINAMPIGTHTLTVGGTIHATGLYVNGQSIATGPGYWQQSGTNLYNLDYNVGIGKANATQKLDVGGIVNADGFHVNGVPLVSSPWVAAGSAVYYGGVVGIGGPVSANPANYSLLVNGKLNATSLYIDNKLVVSSQWVSGGTNVYYDGGVGIGTTLANNPNNYKLAVKGGIGAYDVRVEKTSATWPDYVFKRGYRLPPLAEVESFIQEHGHLEDVPSAPEVERNGHSVGDMNAILLKKVEELTLYIIQLQKEVDALKAAQKDK